MNDTNFVQGLERVHIRGIHTHGQKGEYRIAIQKSIFFASVHTQRIFLLDSKYARLLQICAIIAKIAQAYNLEIDPTWLNTHIN